MNGAVPTDGVKQYMDNNNVVYEVWGGYSTDQYRDEYLDEFNTREEAETYVAEFAAQFGRYAYVL